MPFWTTNQSNRSHPASTLDCGAESSRRRRPYLFIRARGSDDPDTRPAAQIDGNGRRGRDVVVRARHLHEPRWTETAPDRRLRVLGSFRSVTGCAAVMARGYPWLLRVDSDQDKEEPQRQDHSDSESCAKERKAESHGSVLEVPEVVPSDEGTDDQGRYHSSEKEVPPEEPRHWPDCTSASQSRALVSPFLKKR